MNEVTIAVVRKLTVLLQTGTQPIHIATCGGHLNVVSTLVERYGVDPQETTDVRTYIFVMNT